MSQNLTAQQIADLIAGDPAALAQFENTYQALELSEGETVGAVVTRHHAKRRGLLPH